MPDKTAVRNGLLATIAVPLVAAGLRASYSVSMPLAVSVLLIAAIGRSSRGWIARCLAGALIAVPLTVALIIICEQFDSTRWVAKLVSGPGRRT